MAIVINQMIEVKWNNSIKKFYIEKGYEFTNNGDTFMVSIAHLTKGSKAVVRATCDWCNEEFSREMQHLNRSGNKNHFCSNKCQHIHRSYLAQNNKPTKNCEQCGEKYKTEKHNYETSRFCSNKCLAKWQSVAFKGENSPVYVEREEIQCDWCNRKLLRTPAYLKGRRYNFCDEDCRNKWHKEIYVKSEEFIERNRELMLNNISEGKIKLTETKPHLAISSLLNEMNISHTNEYVLGEYSFDIYLNDYDLYIEINGGFWHCDNRFYDSVKYVYQLNRIIGDKRKSTYLKNLKNKKVLYLWEFDIENEIKICELLIELFIVNKGKLNNYHSMNYYLDGDLLKIIKNIYKPYMQWGADKLSKITDLSVREKRNGYQPDKHITFNCDCCGEEKTQLIKSYIKAKNHFCSIKCKNLFQQIGNDTGNLRHDYNCDNCKEPMKVQNYIMQELKNGKRKTITCSKKCQGELSSKLKTGVNNPLYSRIRKICKNCGEEYLVKNWEKDRSKYCSVDCRQKGIRKRIKVKCLNCNEDVYKTPTDIKKNKTGEYFCSHKCHNKYKIEINRENRKCEYSECKRGFIAKKNSTKKYCSISCRNKGVALLNKSSNN